MKALRPYQQAGIDKFMTAPNKRQIFAWATSAGKTAAAYRAAAALGAKRLLIVCPALARPVWAAEAAKWSDYVAHPIRYGRDRKSLTKAQSAERDAAYGAEVRIVSYKLVGQIDAQPVDLVVLDELHALRNPLSQQSKIMKGYLRANPHVAALGLTATPVPTDTKQLWNPLDTFWPGEFGRAQRTGDVSWDFLSRYCGRIENEYGVSFAGSKGEDALQALAAKLGPYIHRVSDREVAPFLPPLHAEPLYVDEKRTFPDLASEWLDGAMGDGATHTAVIAFNRETAWEIAAKLQTQYVATGEFTPEQRSRIIADCKAAPNAVLVATSEAVRESISLSFCTRALICQWRTSPAAALQLMGRFPRQDADITRPTYIQYAVLPGDEERAKVLSERIRDIQALMAVDRKSEQLVEIFKPRPMTDERLDSLFDAMFDGFNPEKAEWVSDEED